MITQTVERIRQAKDRHGDPDGDPDIVDIDGVISWPTDGNGSSANEDQNGQFDRVTTGVTMSFPFGTEILPEDKIRVGGEDGIVYDVEGDAADWASPFTGWAPGTIVTLRRVQGS